jgi:hypothetical protein
MMLIALMLAGAEPSAEALALGRRLSALGTLATLLSVAEKKDAQEMIDREPTMSDKDKTALRATAATVYARERERLLAADGRALATHLSVEDLRTLVAQAESPAARHLREAMPRVIATTLQAVGDVDLGRQVRIAFCANRTDLPSLCAGD